MGLITSTPRPGVALPEGAKLLERQARPLNGVEVGKALTHVLESLAFRLEGLLDGTREAFTADISHAFARITEFQRLHLVYPGVGWLCTLVLERIEGAGLRGQEFGEWLQASVVLDLGRDVRREIQVGVPGRGLEVTREVSEQLSTRIPDKVRQSVDLPVEAEWIKPSTGEVGRVRIPARSVEIGSGATPKFLSEAPKLPSAPELESPTPAVISPELPLEDLIAPTTGIEASSMALRASQGLKVGPGRAKKSYTTLKAEKEALAVPSLPQGGDK